MAQYYKKGSLGMMVKADGGASDPELAEVRLTADEYANMWRRIHAAERATKEAEAEGERKVDAAYKSASRQLAQYEAEADRKAERREQAAEQAKRAAEKKVEEAQAQIQQMKSEVNTANYLNGNLKRIARERANAARGITPKKEHDGYLVLSSRQWTEKYQEDEWDTDEHKKDYGKSEEDRATAIRYTYLKVVTKTSDVWKSVVQTPYDSSIPISQVKGVVEDEIGSVLESVNVDGRLKPEYNGTYYNFGANEDGYERNGMYRWKFNANYRSGFWEMEIYTTKSLLVPEYRRPPKK